MPPFSLAACLGRHTPLRHYAITDYATIRRLRYFASIFVIFFSAAGLPLVADA